MNTWLSSIDSRCSYSVSQVWGFMFELSRSKLHKTGDLQVGNWHVNCQHSSWIMWYQTCKHLSVCSRSPLNIWTCLGCRSQTIATCYTRPVVHTLSVINWRPTTITSLLHWASALVDNTCDGRRAVAKFSKSGFWDKVSDWSTLYCRISRGLIAFVPKTTRSVQQFRYNSDLWQT